ncbi:MAG: sensor histidine kinase [Deltaproteobacteria bacterium]|nr:MAG: sensor histidine kinase [Deltaproteobacteria bacterium]
MGVMTIRLSLVARVLVAFAVVIAALGVSLWTHLEAQARLQGHFTLVTEGYLPVMRGLDELGRELRALQGVTADPDSAVVRQGLRARRGASEVPVRVEALRLHVEGVLAGSIPAGERSFLRNLHDVLPQLEAESRRIADLVRALEVSGDEAFSATRSTTRARLRRMERRTHDLGRVVEVRVDALTGDAGEIARRARMRILWSGGAALLLAVLALAFTVRGLRPVRALTGAAEALRRGEYPGEGSIAAGSDEVGLLVRTFESMARALQERDGELRRQTVVLQEALDERVRAEQALVEAERLAALGEMSSRITHEIRNPLSSISLNVEMLREELDRLEEVDPEVREMFDSVEREVARLVALTGDYLSAVRAREADRRSMDLVPVVRDVLRQMAPRLRRSGIRLSSELPECAPLPGDENQLRQVLWNLLQNAAEALESAETEGRIRVRVEHGDAGTRVWVEDSGPGWAEGDDARIFEPFFSTRAQGTGLGLGISRDVVQAHGGTLTAERSGLLGGATLQVWLPGETTGAEAAGAG